MKIMRFIILTITVFVFCSCLDLGFNSVNVKSVDSFTDQSLKKNEQEVDKVFGYLNLDYVKCLENKLPCECEKAVGTDFLVIVDTSAKRGVFGIQTMRSRFMEFYPWETEEIEKNYFKVNNLLYEKNLSCFLMSNDTLYYTDEKGRKATFIEFFRQKPPLNFYNKYVLYKKLNFIFVNNAFSVRGYELLGKNEEEDTAILYCNKKLGGKNIIFDCQSGKSFDIRLEKDTVYLLETILSREKAGRVEISSEKIVKKYYWPH